jgi:hypothetical protein
VVYAVGCTKSRLNIEDEPAVTYLVTSIRKRLSEMPETIASANSVSIRKLFYTRPISLQFQPLT